MVNYDEIDFDEQCEDINTIYIHDLKEKIKILEKALDEACEELFISVGIRNKEQWKEYLLKEVQDEQV